MKSSIKIDYLDRGTGKGVEPVITVKIINSDDPRDKLIKVLFESLAGENYLQTAYHYWDSRKNDRAQIIASEDKEVVLFRPDGDVFPRSIHELESPFTSRFSIDQKVEYTEDVALTSFIMAEHVPQYHSGTIVAVKFTRAKVYYDVLDDQLGKVREAVASDYVRPISH